MLDEKPTIADRRHGRILLSDKIQLFMMANKYYTDAPLGLPPAVTRKNKEQ